MLTETGMKIIMNTGEFGGGACLCLDRQWRDEIGVDPRDPTTRIKVFRNNKEAYFTLLDYQFDKVGIEDLVVPAKEEIYSTDPIKKWSL
jgi:hypothetical protein